jgi:hypothetical protein
MSNGHRLSDGNPSTFELTKNEIRARRLAALEGRSLAVKATVASSSSEERNTAPYQGRETRGLKRAVSGEYISESDDVKHENKILYPMSIDIQIEPLGLHDLETLDATFWDPNLTNQDKNRWIEQGIHTSSMKKSNNKTNTDMDNIPLHNTWGLLQSHGGPCGVLACVQAEMIRILGLYEDVNKIISPNNTLDALASAMAYILARAALAPSVGGNITKQSHDTCVLTDVSARLIFKNESLTKITLSNTLGRNKHEIIQTLSLSIKDYLLQLDADHTHDDSITKDREDTRRIRSFQETNGVMNFVKSLLATRTVEKIKQDMDDPHSHLTAQFGYSSQELINLLLTGQATSNTFDNTMVLGEGLNCHGIQEQSMIGYLTQLEALRYCSVGDFYKSPKYPIWLVGSTSHFTVLFGSSESLEESESMKLLEKCRRAFKSIPGSEENGFIAISDLENVLKLVDLNLGEEVHTLAASLEMSGSGIILWSDFWKNVSQLCSGSSLESVLQCEEPASNQDIPLLLTQCGESKSLNYSSATNGMYRESDEDMARRLAAEWGSPSDATKMQSDEEMARKLQAEYDDNNNGDSELKDDNSVDAVASQTNDIDMLDEENDRDVSDSVPEVVVSTVKSMDKDGNQRSSFPMFHYNSMRNGTLTKFTVIRSVNEEVVGMPVGLSSSNNHLGHQSGSCDDLEAVLRTKFPGCNIVWGPGKSSPSLH